MKNVEMQIRWLEEHFNKKDNFKGFQNLIWIVKNVTYFFNLEILQGKKITIFGNQKWHHKLQSSIYQLRDIFSLNVNRKINK